MALTPIQKRAERKSRNQTMVDMNLVSLIDVFTILIFFLLSNSGGVHLYDTMGQVVFRERVPIVRKPLAPGETAAFRLPFEGLPDSWNKQMPQLVIAQIDFGQ